MKSLNITEMYHSVQGETSLMGVPTTIVRLGGCNLRCKWCDTSHSFEKGNRKTLPDILTKAQELSCQHICLTGGEPLLQPNVHLLMKQLCDLEYIVSLETSGSLSIQKVDPRVIIILDIKCPESSMSEKNYWQNLEMLRNHDEVKFVMENEKDYRYAIETCQKYNLFSRPKHVLFSPVHGELEPKQLTTWLLRDKIPARLNLQIHKVIWPPDMIGV
ncbi:MAG: radical SAM protein [Waddliaceae bacterium]